ncbi:luciferase [Halobacteriales archaeon QS_5_70_15]|jgi:hypothetical protein|nr:MAG: luciferase [Halobacteriales archaeon QS_5_70_15]
MLTGETLTRAGIDVVTLKPAECDVSRGRELPIDTVAVDYEGRKHLPDERTLSRLAEEKRVLVTTPVRADGFDPLGDDSLLDRLPSEVRRVLVAGHPAYLSEAEKDRAVAPRLSRALQSAPDAWVGTEGVERLAMAAGGVQYDLLSRDTESELRGLRAAGFGGELAVYAPTVLTDDGDAILDAVGAYAARRGPVAMALPEGAPTDSSAGGRAREVLSAAVRDYALVGSVEDVRSQVEALREAGADHVVAYPARGIDDFLA